MAEAPPTVALLVGDVSLRGEVARMARLVDRLARRRVPALVVCSGGADALRELGVPALDDPWLERPWLRRLAARRLTLDEASPRPSLLHAMHDEVAEAGARLASAHGLRLIRTVEDDPAPESNPRFHLPGLAALVVPDAGLARRLAERTPLGPSSFRVIPPGIDPPAAGGPDPHDSPPHRPSLPVIGAIGRFGPQSGFETFLDAIHRVVETGRDVEFLIGGLGPGETRLRRRAGRLELADRLTFSPPAALDSAFWRVISLYVHPATIPTTAPALRSALVAGTPSLACDVPGPDALLADDRGALVPPGDPAALASAIESLLDQPALARSLGLRARAWALPRFDPELEADALALLYQSLAPRR